MQKEILDKFTEQVVKETQKIKIGDPLLEDTRMGPLINRPHLERVLGFVKLAKEQVRHSWGQDRTDGGAWRCTTGGGGEACSALLCAWVERLSPHLFRMHLGGPWGLCADSVTYCPCLARQGASVLCGGDLHVPADAKLKGGYYMTPCVLSMLASRWPANGLN